MSNRITHIINETFDREYFTDFGHMDTTRKLKEQIDAFHKQFPSAEIDILANLRASFPGIQIENWTHLFNLDRCIRFLVQFDEERRYVCQLSIYGYFSVYHCPYHLENKRYIYGKKQFINQSELEECDRMYECVAAITNEQPIWLTPEKLDEIIFDFSIPSIKHDYVIKLADVLFTQHYL